MVRVRKLCSMQGLRWLRSTYEAAVPSGSVAQKVVETYSFAVWTQDTILAWYVCASFVRCKGCAGWGAEQLRGSSAERLRCVLQTLDVCKTLLKDIALRSARTMTS